jgi:hypothetical protein
MSDSTAFDRLELVKRLNWDYDIEPEMLLKVIDGAMMQAGPFNAERLLVRSLERLSWYSVIALWGTSRLSRFKMDAVLPRLRSSELRKRYEFAFKVLQGEIISPVGWCPELRSRVRNGFFSHRWDRAQPVL